MAKINKRATVSIHNFVLFEGQEMRANSDGTYSKIMRVKGSVEYAATKPKNLEKAREAWFSKYGENLPMRNIGEYTDTIVRTETWGCSFDEFISVAHRIEDSDEIEDTDE